MPLARTLAARYARTQEPFEDLFQVASLGLVKAADRYDPDRGAAFSSYALPTILGELKRHFRDKGRSIHLPRGLQELVLRVQAAEEQLSSRTGRSPTVLEIAEHLQLDTESVLEALEAITARNASSLDAPLEAEPGEEAATPHDMIGREDEGYALVDTSSSLAGAVHRLRRTDREVLELRLNQWDDPERDREADRGVADAGLADPAPCHRPAARDDGFRRRCLRQRRRGLAEAREPPSGLRDHLAALAERKPDERRRGVLVVIEGGHRDGDDAAALGQRGAELDRVLADVGVDEVGARRHQRPQAGRVEARAQLVAPLPQVVAQGLDRACGGATARRRRRAGAGYRPRTSGTA